LQEAGLKCLVDTRTT
jgi:hypothetical protein